MTARAVVTALWGALCMFGCASAQRVEPPGRPASAPVPDPPRCRVGGLQVAEVHAIEIHGADFRAAGRDGWDTGRARVRWLTRTQSEAGPGPWVEAGPEADSAGRAWPSELSGCGTAARSAWVALGADDTWLALGGCEADPSRGVTERPAELYRWGASAAPKRVADLGVDSPLLGFAIVDGLPLVTEQVWPEGYLERPGLAAQQRLIGLTPAGDTRWQGPSLTPPTGWPYRLRTGVGGQSAAVRPETPMQHGGDASVPALVVYASDGRVLWSETRRVSDAAGAPGGGWWVASFQPEAAGIPTSSVIRRHDATGQVEATLPMCEPGRAHELHAWPLGGAADGLLSITLMAGDCHCGLPPPTHPAEHLLQVFVAGVPRHALRLRGGLHPTPLATDERNMWLHLDCYSSACFVGDEQVSEAGHQVLIRLQERDPQP